MKECALIGFASAMVVGAFVVVLTAISSPIDYGMECAGAMFFLFGLFGFVALSAYDT